MTQYEAVRLFTDRASAALPEFRITPQNARGIAELCYRLDGIPLAIELAAARVKALSIEQITERLDDRFRLLTGGSRTALPRHQTLLATMDWSYALLSEKERACLRRLSVFAGWTLEAVEAACGWGDVGEAEVFDLLSGLINKSLIVVDHLNGAVRYRMLETIRQYARQKLQDSGEEPETRRRHRDWYLKLAEQAEPELHGPAQATWVERLEVEHDNLRAAMDWSQKDREDTDAGLRLVAAMWRFWWMRGDLTEGRRWLESLLNESPTSRNPARACALVGAGMLAWLQGDYPTATNWWEESLRLARLLNDAKTILDATNGLGLLAITRSDYVAARALYKEALGPARALGDTRRIAVLLNNLGLIAATQGEYATARMLLQESLALNRERGRLRNMFHSLNNLGLVAEAEGDQTSAGRLFEESLRISKDLGYKLGLSHALKNLALVAHRQGDDQRAAAMAEESLALARELGDRDCISDALILLGRLAYRRREDGRAIALWVESLSLRRELGDKPRIAECLERLAQVDPDRSRAARLLGAAAALRETIGAPLAPVDRPDWEQCVAAVRAALGRAVFHQAQEEGRLTPLDRLLVDLLALLVS